VIIPTQNPPRGSCDQLKTGQVRSWGTVRGGRLWGADSGARSLRRFHRGNLKRLGSSLPSFVELGSVGRRACAGRTKMGNRC